MECGWVMCNREEPWVKICSKSRKRSLEWLQYCQDGIDRFRGLCSLNGTFDTVLQVSVLFSEPISYRLEYLRYFQERYFHVWCFHGLRQGCRVRRCLRFYGSKSRLCLIEDTRGAEDGLDGRNRINWNFVARCRFGDIACIVWVFVNVRYRGEWTVYR